MWYGYVGPGLNGVYRDFKEIDRLANLFPYSKFRKFRTEEEAWQFVSTYGNRKALTSIKRYGNTFSDLYVTVEYFIRDGGIYYNIYTKNLGHIKLCSQDENVSIENRTEVILVHMRGFKLNNDLIISHAIAIYQILSLLGELVDVELMVPDQSIFYLLTSYTGQKSSYNRILNYIKSRKGNISITIKDW